MEIHSGSDDSKTNKQFVGKSRVASGGWPGAKWTKWDKLVIGLVVVGIAVKFQRFHPAHK